MRSGDDQVVALPGQGNEIQIQGFGCGINTHAAISCTRKDVHSHGHMGKFLMVIAMNLVCRDVGFLKMVVKQDSGPGSSLPVDENQIRAGQVPNSGDAIGVPLGHDQPLMPDGQVDHLYIHSRQISG